ncbi:MAG TPA: hypothetical protein VHJ20_06755 [Polyangia bacterium]|nr:hypothetical protein [Polyangia bacterium]
MNGATKHLAVVVSSLAVAGCVGQMRKDARADVARKPAAAASSSASRCQQDQEIPDVERGAITESARSFAAVLFGAEPAMAISRMTLAGAATTSPDALHVMIEGVHVTVPSLSDFEVAHTYVVDAKGAGDVERVVCGNPNGND